MQKIKKYIFGYGSLISAEEIFYTLGKEVEVIYPVKLNGWVRDWSVACVNNSTRQFTLLASGLAPVHVAALNVRLPLDGEAATNPNGVLFEVTDSDIEKMDMREKHYSRVDVTEYIDGPQHCIIYTYTGLAEHLSFNMNLEREIILPSSYMNLVNDSSKALGTEFHSEYISSTLNPLCQIQECILAELTPVAATLPLAHKLLV